MITLLDLKPVQKEPAKNIIPAEIPNEQIKTIYASRYYEGSLTFLNLDNVLKQCPNVESICFWTKRPDKLLDVVDKYKNFQILCFITVTSYNKNLEPNVPNKGKVILPAFKKLSEKIGSNNIFWLYEPVFVCKDYNADTHCKNFELIAKNLTAYTNFCLFDYASTFQRLQLYLNKIKTRELKKEEKIFLGKNFISIAKEYNIEALSIKDKNFWSTLNIDLKNKKDAGKGVSCNLKCAYCYGYCGNNIKNIDPTNLSSQD